VTTLTLLRDERCNTAAVPEERTNSQAIMTSATLPGSTRRFATPAWGFLASVATSSCGMRDLAVAKASQLGLTG
jgi:hypothetical protein